MNINVNSGEPRSLFRHKYPDGQSVWQNLHELAYAWTTDGLVDTITETNAQDGLSVIDFTYDNRNRLTRELRAGAHPYDMSYTYDLAGNRMTKIERDAAETVLVTTVYYYDVEEPGVYGASHQGNRLMRSRRFVNATGLAHWTWYDYDMRGRASLVMRKASNESIVHATRMFYDTKENLWLAMAESNSACRSWVRRRCHRPRGVCSNQPRARP